MIGLDPFRSLRNETRQETERAAPCREADNRKLLESVLHGRMCVQNQPVDREELSAVIGQRQQQVPVNGLVL